MDGARKIGMLKYILLDDYVVYEFMLFFNLNPVVSLPPFLLQFCYAKLESTYLDIARVGVYAKARS